MSYLMSNPYVLNLVPLFDVANPNGGALTTDELTTQVQALTGMVNTSNYTIQTNGISAYTTGNTVSMTGIFDVAGVLSVNGFPIGANVAGSNLLTGDPIFMSTGTTGLYMSNTTNVNCNAIQFYTSNTPVIQIDGGGRTVMTGGAGVSSFNQVWVSSAILHADRAAINLGGSNNMSTIFDVWNGDAYFDASVYVNQDVHCQNLYQVSDKRMKTAVQPLQGALSTLCELKGVHYEFGSAKVPSIGFIAQDVYKVLPEAVNTSNPALWSVDYSKIIPLLVEAVKELALKLG